MGIATPVSGQFLRDPVTVPWIHMGGAQPPEQGCLGMTGAILGIGIAQWVGHLCLVFRPEPVA